MPTLSCPNPRPSGRGITPLTVCTSDVQMKDAVVRMTASRGPGSGRGFSITPIFSTPRKTKAFIVSAMFMFLHRGAYYQTQNQLKPISMGSLLMGLVLPLTECTQKGEQVVRKNLANASFS